MNITSGITVQMTDGVFRKVSSSLDWNDFLRLVEEKKVPGYHLDTRPQMGVTDAPPELRPPPRVVVVNDAGEEIGVPTAWDWLRRWTDRLLLVHMVAEEMISSDEAARQIAELFPNAQ
jgi:hypothetical protein